MKFTVMNVGQNTEKLKKDKSSRYFHAEAAMVGTEDAVGAFQAPSLIASGAGAQEVSVLSALLNLPIAFLYLKVPSIIKRIGSRKRAAVFLAIVDALTWLPLIAVLFFLGPVAPLWLIVLWVINLIPGALLLPARDNWLADVVPSNGMGQHLAVRTAVSATVYLVMFYIMGYMLDVFTGRLFKGFAIIFLVAFVATFIKAILYSRIHDSASVVQNQTEFSVSDFLQETKGEGLRRLVIYISLFNFAVYLCSPLFAVYMVKYLRLSYTTFAVVFSSEFIAKAISAPFWGKYSDKIGNLPIVRRVSYLIPFVPILWLASSNVVYLVCVQLFSGVVWAGFDICSLSLVYKAASPEKRAGYIVYKKSLIALCQAFGALAGAGLLSFMFPVLGNRILGLFLLSGILRFIVAKAMLPNTREIGEDITTPIPNGVDPPPQALISEEINTGSAVPVVKPLPKPADWAQYPRRSTSEATNAKSTITVTCRRGLYNRLHDWGDFINPLSDKDATTRTYIRAVTSRRGLFYRPQDWADYVRQEVPKATISRKKDSKTVGPQRGFFSQLRYASGMERMQLSPAIIGTG
ncbi:MAG: MFS transporter [Chloroflexi bacterium]|nr:MFS transporter [Chloroflexota bacterium]